MTSKPACTVVRGWIDRHFSGTGTRELDLRAHLPDCTRCRDYYERWLFVERLDPAALGPERRLAAALGIDSPSQLSFVHHGLVWFWVPLAAAALLILMIQPRIFVPAEFRARGAALESAGAELSVYRFSSPGKAEPLRDEIRRSDELAFAYRGAPENRFLLVFARDEHGHIYWYYPEWTDAATNPEAIAISTDPGRHELPTAISHELDATELELCSVFGRSALHVREIEQHLEHATTRDLERMAGVNVRCRTLRVTR